MSTDSIGLAKAALRRDVLQRLKGMSMQDMQSESESGVREWRGIVESRPPSLGIPLPSFRFLARCCHWRAGGKLYSLQNCPVCGGLC